MSDMNQTDSQHCLNARQQDVNVIHLLGLRLFQPFVETSTAASHKYNRIDFTQAYIAVRVSGVGAA
jgi:hypothetical protein